MTISTYAPAPAASALAVAGEVSESNTLIVTCEVGNQRYGLPISVVREVVRLPALLDVPGAPPFVSGLLNLRGTYLPVLNMRLLVGEPESYQVNNQIIVAGYTDPQVGLLVDRVLDVYMLHIDQWSPISSQMRAAFLQGVVNTGNESVVLFELAGLLELVPEAS